MTPVGMRTSRGLSLIEIMIALAIGSLLLLGLLQVFSASRTAYQLSEGMARAQENARFGMEYLQRDIRMAGHYGCVNDQSHLQSPGALQSHFTAANGGTIGIDFPVSVRGYDATGTAPGAVLNLGAPGAGWTPSLPAAISALAPAAGSDVIELRFLSNEGAPVTVISNPSAAETAITVQAGRWASLTNDGVANPVMFGIADCSYVDVFPASAVNAATRTVTVPVGINRYTPQPSGQTMLYRADSLVYYVAPGASGNPALWRARSAANGTYPAANREELVEGIDNVQLMYGLDRVTDLSLSPPSGYIEFNAPASTITNTPLQWRRTGLVQVGLLASSTDPAAAAPAASAPQRRRALGVEFAPAAGDTRFFAAYEATVALRNRLYGN